MEEKMNKSEYTSPEMEIIEFETEDVITTSPAGSDVGGSNGTNDF